MNESNCFTGDDKSAASPENILRNVLNSCSDCDCCRFLMEESCLFFPELYRLYDKEKECGVPAGDEELMNMAGLCTLCGMCPCPNIRADIIRGKSDLVRRTGLTLANRILADVRRFGRVCSRFPGFINAALGLAPVSGLVKRIAGIHQECLLPRIPSENFFSWAERHDYCRRPLKPPGVAYFAGCTAGYLFPEVARAAVAVLQKNNIPVHVPPQECCGMPWLLEGDRDAALGHVISNLDRLLEMAGQGFDLVTSCPTCIFLMKILLREGAYYSEDYQRQAGAGPDVIKIPGKGKGGDDFIYLKKSMYEKILTDSGYFSGIGALKRIALADAVYDMGDYLENLRNTGRLNSAFGPVPGRMVNFTSCHQRERGGGTSYKSLLALIPGLSMAEAGGSMDCCGMGGNMGYKKDFHEASVRLGGPLMRKILAAGPEAIVTDCLSCRLQFMQQLPYPVFHPLEILARSYDAADAGSR